MMAEQKRKDWRELCAAAAEEHDPEKLANLVEQIIQAIDERNASSLRDGDIKRREEETAATSEPSGWAISDPSKVESAQLRPPVQGRR
jgi:hypothetical protein